MPFPEFEELMRPLLVFLEDGRTRPSEDIRDVLAMQFSVDERQRAELLDNGTSRWNNLVAWALHHLSRARLVERPKKSQSAYRITQRGQDVLDSHKSVDIKLCMEFPEWHRSKRERMLAERRQREQQRSRSSQGGSSPARTSAPEPGPDDSSEERRRRMDASSRDDQNRVFQPPARRREGPQVSPDATTPVAVGRGTRPAHSELRAGSDIDPLDRLAKLADLRDRGALTEAEFDTYKAAILAALADE